MGQSLVSKKFSIHNAKQFIESLTELDSDNYYMCFGKHTPYTGSDASIETPVDTFKYSTITIYDDLIFGKKILPSDVNLVIPKNLWTSGTVYDIYDDEDDLSEKTFFVAAPDGGNYNIYKCIYNNDGGESTVMPTTVDTTVFTESDGYSWKYLYTISSANWTKFTSSSYIPVFSNTTVQAAADDRSIEVILTEYSGSYYNNYFNGSFSTGTQIVSSTQFQLSGDASAFNDFYTGCIIEFTTGSGTEYKEITNYVVSGSDKTITIDSPIEVAPSIGDTYQIYPKVQVYGDGSETSNCLAWAIIDSTASNSVSRVEIIQTGSGYRSSTAKIIFDESVDVSDEAVLRPIISPKNGHGYDPTLELLAHRMCISITVENTESNNIVAANDFRNISIIKNPEFKEIKLEYVGTSAIFDLGETVYQYRPIRLVGTVDANTAANSALLTGNGTLFENSIKIDDYVVVQNSTFSFVTQVTGVANNTQLTVSPVAPSNISSSNVYLVAIEATGIVTTYTSNSVTLTNVTDNFSIDSDVIGSSSYATATLTNVLNNSRNTNDLNTFQQTVKFEGGSTSSELFIEDEYVYQQGTYADENMRPTGRLFKYVDDTTDSLYITNERNVFSSNAVIIGNTSGATFVSINKYNGDLIKDSGEVFYINNVEAVARSVASKETVKAIFQF